MVCHCWNLPQLCKDCLMGKQQRYPFLMKSTWRASQILQLVHCEICGLIKPTIISKKKKKKHLITFTNDYSLKTWISFFLFFTEKLKFFSIFKRFNMHLEKTTYSQHYGVTYWKNVNHYSQFPICKEHAINVLARSSKLSSTCLESQPIIGSER